MRKTEEAVARQIAAMGCHTFEIGLFKLDVPEKGPVMIPRTWDLETLLRSVAWLCRENHDGRNIFCRPKGEHALSLVDDLSAKAVSQMKYSGFKPALVVETSPHNFQAWLNHGLRRSRKVIHFCSVKVTHLENRSRFQRASSSTPQACAVVAKMPDSISSAPKARSARGEGE